MAGIKGATAGSRNGMWGRKNPNAGAKPKPAETRFMKLFRRGDRRECWEWLNPPTKGYPVFWDGEKNEGAHRYSYRLFCGSIPTGLGVLHKCDNKKCVNPGHLFLGTLGDNNRDCVAKNRHRWRR